MEGECEGTDVLAKKNNGSIGEGIQNWDLPFEIGSLAFVLQAILLNISFP